MNYKSTSMASTALPASIPFNADRRYLAVIATSPVTVTIAGGTPFGLDTGSVWAPIPACMNDIAFTGNGVLVLG